MQHNFIQFLAIFGSGLLSPAATQAQLVLDGSLGQAETLIGPEYQIGAELGQQQGGNLFHSFQDFNLQSHETATFSGPDTVHNIINRVTGGTPSNIDGLIRSTIPNADFYFLNPYGILFGPHAKLDLQGGFHVSTADYLRLEDGGRFEARYPNNSLLTSAPVAAFGFWTDSPAPISVQDSQLTVPDGKTLSWIGGHLDFTGSIVPSFYDEIYSAKLEAKSGRLNLASIAARGEIMLTPSGLELPLPTQLGEIIATNTVFSVTSDEGHGGVFIRAAQFYMTYGWFGVNNTNQPGGVVKVEVDNLLLDSGVFDISAYGKAVGGALDLKVTDTFDVKNEGGIHVHTVSGEPQAGKAGEVNIQARQINLSSGGNIAATTWGTGKAGTVRIQVLETLNIDTEGYVWVGSNSIIEEVEDAGNGGNMIIEARNVKLATGGGLVSASVGSGHGGLVSLKVHETLSIVGQESNTGIFASSIDDQSEHAGNAGHIYIEAAQIILQDGGKIVSNTYGVGQGGTVHLQVADHLTISGRRYTDNSPSGIYAGSLDSDELYGDGLFLREDLLAGQAGEIVIQANTLNLLNGGKISAQQTRSTGGGGGNITLSTANRLYLHQGQIITSVKGGEANSGNITIENPQFMILSSGQIVAQADAGRGGNIRIVTDHLLTTLDSLISASSRLGIDGQVDITSPDINISNGLLGLSNQLRPVNLTFKNTCGVKSWEEFLNRGTFFVHSLAGRSWSPFDLQPSFIK